MAGEARCGPGPRGAAVWEAVLLWLCLGVPTGHPYNVDTESALLYQGPPQHPVRIFGGAAQPRGEPMVSGVGLGALGN